MIGGQYAYQSHRSLYPRSFPQYTYVERSGETKSPDAMLVTNTAVPYDPSVRTVAETAIFKRYAEEIWTDDERDEFITWIAANPTAGDVIPDSGGCRKVRWSSSSRGKRGGARIIYFNASDQTIWLLIVYTKAKFDKLPKEFLAKLRQGVENAL